MSQAELRTGSQAVSDPRSGGVRQNAINRAIAGLALGTVQTIAARDVARKNMGIGEFELQYQVPISGQASTAPLWDRVAFDFDTPFYYAPENRDSDLNRPQLSYMAVIDTGDPVVVSACVTTWAIDPVTEGVIGATVAVGVFLPDTSALVSFGGYLHVTFQGYGGVAEDESDVN